LKETGIHAMSAYGLTETFGPSTIYIPQDPDDYPNATETERDAQLQVVSRRRDQFHPF
jgi:hypothetical protein